MSIIYAIDIYRLQNHETAKQLGVDAPKRSPGSESRCHAVYPAMPGSSVATTGIRNPGWVISQDMDFIARSPGLPFVDVKLL